MTLNIELSDPVLKRLQFKAKESRLSVEQLVTPPNPAFIRSATGSLLEHLRNTPVDPDFDIEGWMEQWHQFEQEMKDTERRNRIAEGLV